MNILNLIKNAHLLNYKNIYLNNKKIIILMFKKYDFKF